MPLPPEPSAMTVSARGRFAGCADLVDVLAAMPAEIEAAVLQRAGPLSLLLWDRLPLPLAPEAVSLVWIQCFVEDRTDLLPLLPEMPLAWELLFVHSSDMLAALRQLPRTKLNLQSCPLLHAFAANPEAAIWYRFADSIAICAYEIPGAGREMLPLLLRVMPDWRDDQNKRAALAVAACSAGDAALALDAVRGLPATLFSPVSSMSSSLLVAATAQGHEALALELFGMIGGSRLSMKGIVASNSLRMVDAVRDRFPTAELDVESMRLAIRLHRNELVFRFLDWFETAIMSAPYNVVMLAGEAAKAANADVLALLLRKSPNQASHAFVSAAKLGYLAVLQDIYNTLPDAPWSANVLAAAAEGKQRDLVAWLVRGPLALRSAKAMEHAARHGDLAMVEILHHDGAGLADTLAMDAAAAAGHLHVVVWLRAYRKEGCTNRAICEAAKRNDLAMVKFLHDQCRRRCDKATLCFCIMRSHLEVAEFLLAKQTRLSKMCFRYCVERGMLDMVKLLHRFRPRYDWQLMHEIAKHPEMIEWLAPRATPPRKVRRRIAREKVLREREMARRLEQLRLESPTDE
ncbi:hypothetical protein HK105_205319 [Polyrhizophydium stewartii]|uniref:Ankyrin repeat protein n=1 Tax=Polyrhizophydium stewartii TaxID=2732419 RepID=A0ABR4N6R5_9FUNG